MATNDDDAVKRCKDTIISEYMAIHDVGDRTKLLRAVGEFTARAIGIEAGRNCEDLAALSNYVADLVKSVPQ